MQEEALNKFFESNKWDTYSCYDIFKRLYSNIIALIRYNGSEKKTKGSPLKHCWGARVVFRTDRDPLCQILDIIRFNDPPPPDASVPPVPSPVYQAVHHGPCRVSSGCCHGGSLSSSLTSATLFSVRNDYIYTYIHIYHDDDDERESIVRRLVPGNYRFTGPFVSPFARLYRVVSQNRPVFDEIFTCRYLESDCPFWRYFRRGGEVKLDTYIYIFFLS